MAWKGLFSELYLAHTNSTAQLCCKEELGFIFKLLLQPWEKVNIKNNYHIVAYCVINFALKKNGGAGPITD